MKENIEGNHKCVEDKQNLATSNIENYIMYASDDEGLHNFFKMKA